MINLEDSNVIRGVLFTEPQGDYYELTGKKPLGAYKDSNGKYVVTATPEYFKYLEEQLMIEKMRGRDKT